MNQLNLWFNGPPHHNILLYNSLKFNISDLELCIKKTIPSIIFIYNYFLDDKLDLISKIKFDHHFYTKLISDEKKYIDTGLIILSSMPIIIYNNIRLEQKSNRIGRSLTFAIRNYQFKIIVNPDEEINGYTFEIKFVPTNDEIIYTHCNITNNITLLKK